MVGNLRIKLECAVCPTRIWQRKGAKLKKSPEYNEITVTLNDLSNMVVGVCSRHQHPTTDELNAITKKTHEGWLEEIALGLGNKDWVLGTGINLRAVKLVEA